MNASNFDYRSKCVNRSKRYDLFRIPTYRAGRDERVDHLSSHRYNSSAWFISSGWVATYSKDKIIVLAKYDRIFGLSNSLYIRFKKQENDIRKYFPKHNNSLWLTGEIYRNPLQIVPFGSNRFFEFLKISE